MKKSDKKRVTGNPVAESGNNMIRTANRGDAEGILKTLESAFSIEKGCANWVEKRNLVLGQPEDWRVLIERGRVMGAVHIPRDWLKIGKSKILKGDVGEVSILPECQGKGYGTRLMEDSMSWMKKKEFDISRLGGLLKFYARFGFWRFPRRRIEFLIGTEENAGASMVVGGEIPFPDECHCSKNKTGVFKVKGGGEDA